MSPRCALSAGVGLSSLPETRAAVQQAIDMARGRLQGEYPTVAIVTATVDRDMNEVHGEITSQLPDVQIHGATTCAAVLDVEGVHPNAVGVLLMAADDNMLTAASPVHDTVTPLDAGKRAAEQLMSKVPAGVVVRHIILSATPGIEEDVMEGIHAVVGEHVPVFGGSAADNTVEGNWRLITSSEGVLSGGVSLVAVLGDSISVGASLVPPYLPSEKSAKITSAEGRRIFTLDGLPAAQVLREWVGESIEEQSKNGGNIVVQTAAFPLGIQKSNSHHVGVHAAGINMPEGSVDLFTQVATGETLTVMTNKGNKDSVAAAAIGLKEAYEAAARQGSIENPVAGLLMYCGGMSIAVGDGLADSLTPLKGKPQMLGMTVFGEQGSFGGRNLHSNLAVGVALFE